MGFPALYRGFLALLLVLTTQVSRAQEDVPEEDLKNQVEFPVDAMLQSLKQTLSQHERVPFPGFPIIIPGNDQVSLSITLANLYLDGLTNVEVTPKIRPTYVSMLLDFTKISLYVGSYTASGHIINLGFNGEGPMYIKLHNLLVWFTFDLQGILSPCAVSNTTDFDLDLLRLEVHMEGLNEGSDQGQLVNIVLGSFGQDIVERLEVLLKTKYDFIDSALIGIVNSFLPGCGSERVDDFLNTDQWMEVVEDIVNDMIPGSERVTF